VIEYRQEHKICRVPRGMRYFFYPGPLIMLKPNHIKALALLRENALSVKEEAAACNLSTEHLYNLIEGAPNAGDAGVLFCQEFKKIKKECSKRTKQNVVTLTDRIVEDLLEWNESLPDGADLDLKQVRAKKEILDSLTKVGAGVEVGELHLHQGLTGGELVDEFKRLKSLVDLAAKGGRISEAIRRRSGVLPVSAKGKASRPQGETTPLLPSEPEAGDLPQE